MYGVPRTPGPGPVHTLVRVLAHLPLAGVHGLADWLCVQERVRAAARRHPAACAVRAGHRSLTYGDLWSAAERLAAALQHAGVRRGDRVALCVERSPELVLGQLASVLAGAAFVPVDPAYPAERRAFLLRDAAPAALLTTRALAELVEDAAAPLLLLEEPQPAAALRPVGLTPDDLAYVVYTSGSTGRPKGVEVPQRGLTNLVDWHLRRFGP